MKAFVNATLAEFFKVKRNSIFLILLLMPVVLTLIMMLVYIFDDDLQITNFWLYYGADISMFYAVFYPGLMSLVTFTVVNMEIKNYANKQMFYLPIEPYEIYLSKCVVIISYFTLSVIIAYLSFIISTYVLGLIVPEISAGIQHYDSMHIILVFFVKTYLLTLPIIFFLFFLSLTFPKLWVPTTTAFLLYVGGLMAFNTTHYYLLPNASLTKMAWLDLQAEIILLFDKATIISIGYIIIFVILGYFSFAILKDKMDC